MDLLYSKYASPMEFMRIYIEQGRFGEFVAKILDMDEQAQIEKANKENEQKMWDMYIHSMSDKSFNDWKKEVLQKNVAKPQTLVMDDVQVADAKQQARDILKNFSPAK